MDPMQKAAKEKTFLLVAILSALFVCAPATASSTHDLTGKTRAELFLPDAQNSVGSEAFDTAKHVENYDSPWEVASESSVAPNRGAALRAKYPDLSPAQRAARIDELSNANYMRRLQEELGGQEYVYRYLSEDGLATSLKYNSVRGYTTTQLSASSRAVAEGAQIKAAWGVPRYGVAIPVDKLRGYKLARPLGGDSPVGWEFKTYSYPEAGPGGWTQFLVDGVPLDDVHIFTLRN